MTGRVPPLVRWHPLWVSLTAAGGVAVHGGVKFYRGFAGAARSYVEADRSRVDDYYLAEGTGLAELLTASSTGGVPVVNKTRLLDGDEYERWVAGREVDGTAKGRLRTDDQALRFVEVVVNGPKTWSLAAVLHPEVTAAYDAAQDRAAREIVAWLTEHSTTRVGPRGRQVQVPVERLEAAVVRHHTSRAGDPHRHLHLQVNARVFAAGRWRGLHSVGVVDSIDAINGIGHATVATDAVFRRVLADLGYTLDPATGEIAQLQPYVAGFSARAAQIGRHVDRFETHWRTEHPGQEPGPRLRQAWDRRAWATARPDKVVPTNGVDLTRHWVDDLTDAGFTPPTPPQPTGPTEPSAATTPLLAGLDPDAVSDLVLTRLAGRRSAWNAPDIRGEVEQHLTVYILEHGPLVDPALRRGTAEHLVEHTVRRCVPLLDRDDVPEHVRALSSPHVLGVEADIVARLAHRTHHGLSVPPTTPLLTGEGNPPAPAAVLDPAQRSTACALAGTHPLLLVEGAAGAGKTATLAAARHLIEADHRRLVIVTPTLKAAQVAATETGAPAFSAAWLAHQHGYRWDDDHQWTRSPTHPQRQDPRAWLAPGDVLLVDEAGMLDQDTARALLTIADDAHAQVALVGDRHQLPAVGRGGVLDLAARWTPLHARLELDTVHRFSDPDYAALTLHMRTGQDPAAVFDTLHARGDITIHPTDVQRTAHLAHLAATAPSTGHPAPLVIADTRAQVRALNAAIRGNHQDHQDHCGDTGGRGAQLITGAGEAIGAGDPVMTRRNDPDLQVANRDRWTVTGIDEDGVTVTGRPGTRELPVRYALAHLELAYATTAYGAQGDTVDTAHLLLGQTTTSASAYVAMTRGRHHNIAHLVADTLDDARAQWVTTFTRDRADLGPTQAATRAAEDIDRFGPAPPASIPISVDSAVARRLGSPISQ